MSLSFEILPLPLLKKNEGGLLRCAEIRVYTEEVLQHQEACLKVISNSSDHEISLGLLLKGINTKEFFLKELIAETEFTFILSYGDKRVSSNLIIKPAKKWLIHLVLHSHTDLGFTAPISEVAQIHNDNTDLAVLYCKETEHWPELSRFKWTCEVSWQIQNYLNDRSPEKVNSFLEQVRKRDIEIAGLYSGELTEVLGHEQACRSFYYAAKLRRDYGITIDTAMLCDVPGCTKGFVQVMAKSGIRNFILADNNFVAPFLSRTDLPRPFYWRGDDDSRVLAWYTDHPFYAYIEGQNYGLSESYSETRNKLPAKLIELEKNGYALDELQLQYAFDNFRIEFRPAAVVKEWNETWEFPKIKLSTAGEFLNNVRQKYDAQIPVIKGDWTDWWSGIVTGFPHEASLSRHLHNKIPALEILTTSAALHNAGTYPLELFSRLYDQTLAFDEHSGSGLVWEEKSKEQQQKALREGYGYINDSFNQAVEYESKLKSELSSLINNDSDSEVFAVFNPLNFRAGGVVSTSSKEFFANDVPPLGYKLFDAPDIYNRSDVSQLVTADEIIIENPLFKVRVNRRNGKLASLFSKKLNRELARKAFNSPVVYKTNPVVKIEMGKFIPEIYNGLEVPGNKKELKSTIDSGIITNEIYGTIILVNHLIEGKNWLTQKIYMKDDIVCFENIVSGILLSDIEFLRNHLSSKGMLYFQFDFKIDKPGFRHDAPCAVIYPADESFIGSCMDHNAVQNWLQLFNDDAAITFMSKDAPLHEPGGISLQKYRKKYPENLNELYVRALSLSESNLKYKSPYTNNPDVKFRFAVSADASSSLLRAHKYGQQFHNELIPVTVPPKNKGLLNAKEHSFFDIKPESVQVMTIKAAEANDNSIIIRLREAGGAKSKVELNVPGKKIIKAFRTQITEEIIQELSVSDNKIIIDMAAFSVETLNIHFE